MIAENPKLTHLQLELLKGIRHLGSEEQIEEVRTLLNMYFRGKLDAAINKEEDTRGFTAAVYEQWLKVESK